jgi:hypothetical protein
MIIKTGAPLNKEQHRILARMCVYFRATDTGNTRQASRCESLSLTEWKPGLSPKKQKRCASLAVRDLGGVQLCQRHYEAWWQRISQ